MKNLSIREAARQSHVYLWEIAVHWPCTDSNFSRKLRCQFSPEEEGKALAIIREIAKERETSRTGED